MPRPTTLPCACGAEIAVKRDGPLPTRCAGCVRVDQIGRLLLRLVEDVPAGRAIEVARMLNAARMRLVRKVGVLA